MNPKEFKQINIIKDLRYSQINIPLSNDNLNSNDWGKIQSKLNDENWENKTPKLNKISQDKWENRTPILNKTNEKKIENTTPILFKTNEEKYEWEKRKSKKSIEEKAYIGKEEKEITFLNRDETLTLNNSQENNFKPFITKEKLGYIQIDNSNSNKNNNENDILNESTNTISMKNKMIERTNNYFNNLSTKVSFKSEYAKTLLNEKNLNHSINYDTKQVNKYTSETRFNREFDKENWNPDSSSKSSNNNLNESVIINDEKERSDFIIKIYNAKMKEEDSYKLNKADSSIVNEKEKENDKGSILNSYRNNNYSLHKIIGGNNYNLNYSKK